jgi:putative tricarboxylic transport membrane protein
MPKTLRLVLPHGLMLLASILLYWAATRIEADTGGGGRIGPDAWPKAIIVLMGLLCAWEIAKRLALRSRMEPKGEASADEPAAQPRKLASGIAIIFGYVLAVPWIGFFLATTVFLALFPWLGGFRRPVLTTVTGLAGSFVLVVMFMRVAYISLPLGEGPFRTLSIALLAAIGVS